MKQIKMRERDSDRNYFSKPTLADDTMKLEMTFVDCCIRFKEMTVLTRLVVEVLIGLEIAVSHKFQEYIL